MIVRSQARLPSGALLSCGLALALTLRLAVSGGDPLGSIPAGLIFSSVLAALSWASGWRPRIPRAGALLVGAGGGLVLLAFPFMLQPAHTAGVRFPADAFLPWAAVVCAVAVSEEVLIRGALFRVLEEDWGLRVAVPVTAIAFALLHVPLYGWGALPLDLAVGVWLGGLRVLTGGVAAPAVAHTVADLGTWWVI